MDPEVILTAGNTNACSSTGVDAGRGEPHYVEVEDRDVPSLLAEFEAIGDDPREVQRVPQPCCLKKERERYSPHPPALHVMKRNRNQCPVLTRGSPRSESLIAKQPNGQA